MGKLLSVVSNPFKNFNVESRAHKLISKDKPTPAPKYKVDQLNINHLLKEYPKEYEDSLKKNEKLDNYLKDVYVTSQDPKPKESTLNTPDPEKPLPLDRTTPEDFEYGFKEPAKVPLGKITLRNALKFISDHQTDRQTYNSSKIAAEYLLPEETVENILKYYKVYEVYVPQDRRVKAKFAGPSVPRVRVEVREHKKIESGKPKDDT